MKEVLPPPADWHPREEAPHNAITNPEHPLNRKSTYNPKEPKNLVLEANRRLQVDIELEQLDAAWGPEWRNENA